MNQLSLTIFVIMFFFEGKHCFPVFSYTSTQTKPVGEFAPTPTSIRSTKVNGEQGDNAQTEGTETKKKLLINKIWQLKNATAITYGRLLARNGKSTLVDGKIIQSLENKDFPQKTEDQFIFREDGTISGIGKWEFNSNGTSIKFEVEEGKQVLNGEFDILDLDPNHLKLRLFVKNIIFEMTFICLQNQEVSSKDSQPATNLSIPDIEAKLRNAMSTPKAVIVVKDVDDLYWAFPVTKIEMIEKNTIKLKTGCPIARSDSKGSSSEIAEVLINILQSGSSGYFYSLNDNNPISGNIGSAKKNTIIGVKESIICKIP